MKALKIILILLVPALGFVGCKKSDMNNRSGHECSSSNSTAPEPETPVSAGRHSSDVASDSDDENNTDVVGSSDDDRDGGDKKKVRR